MQYVLVLQEIKYDHFIASHIIQAYGKSVTQLLSCRTYTYRYTDISV